MLDKVKVIVLLCDQESERKLCRLQREEGVPAHLQLIRPGAVVELQVACTQLAIHKNTSCRY
mgnify:CR=1 FL=1